MSWKWLEGAAFNDAFKGVSTLALEDEMERREPSIEMVVAKLCELRETRERQGFERQAREEEGCNDEPEFESDEEEAAFRLKQETMVKLERAGELALYEQLNMLGARMMRPYEHHNEDERLMEYLERDR